jgi:hypothetical protein
MAPGSLKLTVQRETALFLVLVLFGLLFVPMAIYWVGPQTLGEFGGNGFGDFFGSVSERIRKGNGAAWFFVLAPYLTVQTLRLTLHGWRAATNRGAAGKL